MVSTEYIAARAMAYDTVVARAFRRALGLATTTATVKHGGGGHRKAHPYAGMGWCFANHHEHGGILGR